MAESEVIVVGSHVYGAYIRCNTLPRPGETVAGHGFEGFVPDDGGKGSNQAFCAAQLGAATTFLGMIGLDAQGALGMKRLAETGCDVSHVRRIDGKPTGVSVAIIDQEGRSMIVTDPGANIALTDDLVDSHRQLIARHRCCLVQFETPAPIALHVARRAQELGLRAIVTPGPMQALAPDALKGIDILIPNETEAAILLERDNIDDLGEIAAKEIAERWGVHNVVLTRGARGVTVWWNGQSFCIPAFEVEAHNTIGAGDGFAAAMAVALSREVPIAEALRFASAVAALAVQSSEAPWASYPRQAAVHAFLAVRGLSGLAEAVFRQRAAA